MIYINVTEILPTSPSLKKTTKSKLAQDLIDAWRVVQKIDSVFKFQWTCSFDLQRFLGTMISLEELAKGRLDNLHDRIIHKKNHIGNHLHLSNPLIRVFVLYFDLGPIISRRSQDCIVPPNEGYDDFFVDSNVLFCVIILVGGGDLINCAYLSHISQ